ncbi:hypothetical protein ACS0TY_030195 [Phlomoides rotata]
MEQLNENKKWVGIKKESSVNIAFQGNIRENDYNCFYWYYPFDIGETKLIPKIASFYRLCHLLQHIGGLKSSKYINVYEKVAMFLSILAHHSKNRCVKFQFKRSGQTVSKQFHSVLRSVLKLHYLLLVKPHPIPEDSDDARWGKFKATFAILSMNLRQTGLSGETQLHKPCLMSAGFRHEVDKKKSTRGRRSWSRVEEDALIHCLTDIVNDGWKADNGFKAGFFRELEKGMRRILPATDIIANPHINSKIHYNFAKLADPQLKGIRYKTWPYYSYWLEILGKDRATGENAMEPIDLVNHILRSGHGDQEGDTGEKYCPINPLNNNEAENNNICKPEGSGKLPASKGVKRKNRDNEVNSLVESLGAFMKQSHETRLIGVINRIVGLKVADRLKVCDELVQNTNRLDLFMSLPEEDQDEYVWMLLDGRLPEVASSRTTIGRGGSSSELKPMSRSESNNPLTKSSSSTELINTIPSSRGWYMAAGRA